MKWFSSSIDLVAWPVEDSREEFQKKKKIWLPEGEAEEIANRNMMGAREQYSSINFQADSLLKFIRASNHKFKVTFSNPL